MAPKIWKREPLTATDGSGPKFRWLTPPPVSGWTEPVISEWELTGEAWTDRHEHDEYAYVLEGRLFVESDGVTVEVGPGEMVCVPRGATGRYWAPDYARMLGIYGANPEGAPMSEARYEKLSPEAVVAEGS